MGLVDDKIDAELKVILRNFAINILRDNAMQSDIAIDAVATDIELLFSIGDVPAPPRG